MNKTFLSKSRYCKCVKCEKILWLSKYKQDILPEIDESAFEEGRNVGELAKGLFGDYEDVPYDKDMNARIRKTKKLLEGKPNVIAEASFIYDNNFCSVDILKNDSDGVEIYEVKSSAHLKDIYLDDVAYQYFVLSNLGLNVKRACIVYINNEYVRGKELDIGQLFKIEDLTEVVLEKQDEIRDNIEMLTGYMEVHNGNNEPVKDLGIYCLETPKCDFWEYCTRDLPKPNVFDIAGMRKFKKFENYYGGKVSFEDLKNEKLNKKYMEQIDFELNDRDPKIEKEAIKDFLNRLKYPLYFIDYESCKFAIPELEGTKPYQQIPFQYSLHIIKEEGAPVEHKEYLAEGIDDDMIRNFAESMIGDMPEDGSVIVYHKSFESGRNKEIGEMYPDLKEEMEKFNRNMVDLEEPFKKRNYYVKEMGGYSTIKKVLPALFPDDPEMNYGNLPLIHNGYDASKAFPSLKDKAPEEWEEIRKALLKYCGLDTFAMVKIWEKFREATSDY